MKPFKMSFFAFCTRFPAHLRKSSKYFWLKKEMCRYQNARAIIKNNKNDIKC